MIRPQQSFSFTDSPSFELILIDTDLVSSRGAPFPPMQFSRQWLREDVDKGVINVRAELKHCN
jgi:hypothetical protein